MAFCPHCRSDVPALATRCPNCAGTFESSFYRDLKGIGLLIILGVVAFILLIIWMIIKWIYNLIIQILAFIWYIVTWPFLFIWQGIENLIVGPLSMVGINHDPVWWETSLLAALIILMLGILWKPMLYKKIEENRTISNNKLKITITTCIVLLLIASSAIWSPSTIDSDIQSASTTDKLASTEIIPLTPKDAPQEKTLVHANEINIELKGTELVKAPPAVAGYLSEMLHNFSNSEKLNENKITIKYSLVDANNQPEEIDVDAENIVARNLIVIKKINQAEIALGKNLAVDPGNVESWSLLGQIYAVNGDIHKAAAAIVIAYQFAKMQNKSFTPYEYAAKIEKDDNFQFAVDNALRHLSKNN
jgi:hypothetical protein